MVVQFDKHSCTTSAQLEQGRAGGKKRKQDCTKVATLCAQFRTLVKVAIKKVHYNKIKLNKKSVHIASNEDKSK